MTTATTDAMAAAAQREGSITVNFTLPEALELLNGAICRGHDLETSILVANVNGVDADTRDGLRKAYAAQRSGEWKLRQATSIPRMTESEARALWGDR